MSEEVEASANTNSLDEESIGSLKCSTKQPNKVNDKIEESVGAEEINEEASEILRILMQNQVSILKRVLMLQDMIKSTTGNLCILGQW